MTQDTITHSQTIKRTSDASLQGVLRPAVEIDIIDDRHHGYFYNSDRTNSLRCRLLISDQFFCQFDDHAPSKLNIFCLGTRRTDGKPQEIQTLAFGRNQMDPPVIVDFTQQLAVQLVATLSTDQCARLKHSLQFV